MKLSVDSQVQALVSMALLEDIGPADLTSQYFVPQEAEANAYLLVKEGGVIAGHEVVLEVFRQVDKALKVEILVDEGTKVAVGTRVMKVSGPARSLLTAERVALNFMQRLSGIATKTARFVQCVSHTKAVLLDTRKTTPGWRLLEKRAVVAGGGQNHRMGLYDRVMVKDNHLVAQHDIVSLKGSIASLKKSHPDVEVELEADTLEQVEVFLKLQDVDYILLDNMSNEMLKQAVLMRQEGGPLLEASGGVTMETISDIAATGVDFISVGAITHSAVALDISLEFVEVE